MPIELLILFSTPGSKREETIKDSKESDLPENELHEVIEPEINDGGGFSGDGDAAE